MLEKTTAQLRRWVPQQPSETLWNVLKQGRYLRDAKRKTQWASDISQHLNPDPLRNESASFCYFCVGLAALR